MKAIDFNERWHEIKSKLKTKYPHLNEDDLFYVESKKGVMIAKLQLKLGKSKEDLFRLLDTFK